MAFLGLPALVQGFCQWRALTVTFSSLGPDFFVHFTHEIMISASAVVEFIEGFGFILISIFVVVASILRQIVAGPRLQHPETGLDLCYVADNIIATSGPSTNYPKIAYRTPLKQLISFLDEKHGADWCIWEFRAEGTGYPDSEVYGRIHHFPFPDHHPPPFALIPKVMASMRNWLHRLDGPVSTSGDGKENESGGGKKEKQGQRIVVVHCKAGKGRSGSMACSYLISQEGWKMEDALQRFTERRMRVGFGEGVSIPSQLRWVRYVNRWTNEMGKRYVERPVEIIEIHVWGLRDGVKVAVEGFVEDGQKIKHFHLFRENEHVVMPGDGSQSSSTGSSSDGDGDGNGNGNNNSTENFNKAKQKLKLKPKSKSKSNLNTPTASTPTSASNSALSTPPEPQSAAEPDSDSGLFTPNLPSKANTLATSNPISQSTTNTNPTTTPTTTTTITAEPHPHPQKHTSAVLLRPSTPLILPSSDINIDFERRSKAASYTGLPMVTSVAHVWFNPYFEGGDRYDSGVFEVEWDAMDGIKGTSRKGIKALDRLKVLWRYAGDDTVEARDADHQRRPVSSVVVEEPRPGEEIPETRVVDWKIRESETEREVREEESSAEDDEGAMRAARRKEKKVEEKEKENIPLRDEGVKNKKKDGDDDEDRKDKAPE
ncbi:putative phosphatidylinositol-3,4,5-trisphosphate 3-phosphatase [Aspergillus undulatus]|uniref:putative phosphatidylinositol-3,4,5-trisphosphate 3-phosphatase n=1 Tax=Aspergillus undulatus TaxID=1810928 RepID=UPI003CCDB0B8